MHIPWGWIKQRPHFLAEELSKIYQLDIYTPKVYKKNSLIENETKLKINELFKLPFERFLIVRKLNSIIIGLLLKYIYEINNYKYIWLTDLRLYPQIEKVLKNNQQLIYDCMDDVVEFDVLVNKRKELLKIEQSLFSRSNLIFFSSEELKNRKVEQYKINQSKYEVVLNAFDNSFLQEKIYQNYDSYFEEYHKKGFKVLTYIGTISSWFDFETLQKSLKEFDNIVYFIVGPFEPETKKLEHPRIVYFGSVEHKFVKSLIIKSDIMIMPFKINKLITAVDPVKLYEYIALGKSILTVEYKELLKFKEFVNFYSDYNTFKFILETCMQNSNNTKANDDFIRNNSWHSRVKEVIQLMNSI